MMCSALSVKVRIEIVGSNNYAALAFVQLCSEAMSFQERGRPIMPRHGSQYLSIDSHTIHYGQAYGTLHFFHGTSGVSRRRF